VHAIAFHQGGVTLDHSRSASRTLVDAAGYSGIFSGDIDVLVERRMMGKSGRSMPVHVGYDSRKCETGRNFELCDGP
jgi:hypothetical protein